MTLNTTATASNITHLQGQIDGILERLKRIDLNNIEKQKRSMTTEKEFTEKMKQRYQELKYTPELMRHQIDHILKEIDRISSNESKLWNGCDELDKRIAELEVAVASNQKERKDKSRVAYLENCLHEKNVRINELTQQHQELQKVCGKKSEKLQKALNDLNCAIENDRESRMELHKVKKQLECANNDINTFREVNEQLRCELEHVKKQLICRCKSGNMASHRECCNE